MFEYQKMAILEFKIAIYILLSQRIERVVLVATYVLQKTTAKEHFQGALSGALRKAEDTLNISTAHKGIGLEKFTHNLLDLLFGDVGRVGLFGRAFKASALTMTDEGLLGREHHTLDRDILSAHLCRIVRFGRGERERE